MNPEIVASDSYNLLLYLDSYLQAKGLRNQLLRNVQAP